VVWILAGSLVLMAQASGAAGPVADLVVVGQIHTMAKPGEVAEGMAVADVKILFVGPAAGAEVLLAPHGKIVRLPPDAIAMPGLVDSHVHMLDAGGMRQYCVLDEQKTREAMSAAIVAYAKAHPDLPWVLGSGWPPQFFADGVPTKEELDALVPDRPAVFYGQDGHSAWANSLALQAAGIAKDTPDPPRGRIERHPETGEPAGTLREAACDLVDAHVPKPDHALYEKGLRDAQSYLHSLGVTLIQDANVTPRMLEAYSRAEKEGVLTMKVVAAQATDPGKRAAQVEELAALREEFTGGKLTASSAKIFLDGVLEARTAALLEPYENSQERGILNWPPERLKEIAIALDRAGFQIHMHAIGDEAIREGLDAIAAVRAANGVLDNRHHMAHLELFDPVDLPRFAELGVTANFQPFWMFADDWITEHLNSLIGEERSGRVYPIRSVADTGARIAAGSDWPVSTPNPFQAIQVGITREDVDRAGSPPWIPNERVSRELLLAAYTINGAWLNHREKETGSLEVGKAADFIIVDRDVFSVPVQEIGQTRVLSTYVNGRLVYQYKPGAVSQKLSGGARKTTPVFGGGCSCRSRHSMAPGRRVAGQIAGRLEHP
jgi:predicted amidohydrolase YtcJ